MDCSGQMTLALHMMPSRPGNVCSPKQCYHHACCRWQKQHWQMNSTQLSMSWRLLHYTLIIAAMHGAGCTSRAAMHGAGCPAHPEVRSICLCHYDCFTMHDAAALADA